MGHVLLASDLLVAIKVMGEGTAKATERSIDQVLVDALKARLADVLGLPSSDITCF